MNKRFLRYFLLGALGLSALGCWCILLLRLYFFASGRGAGPDEIILLLISVLLVICVIALYLGIFRQLDDLEDVVFHWESIRPQDLRASLQSLSGPVGQLGDVFYKQMTRVEEKLTGIRQEVEAETERAVKAQAVRDICQSALPRHLPDYPSRNSFSVAGIVRDGWEPACVFYDTFFVDPGLLGVVVGQVADNHVSGALFLTLIQTTIRSRLRAGRSLADAMAEVNSHVYALGTDRTAAALVGTLDTTTGNFTYVNAGCRPLLLKHVHEDFQWHEAPIFAPLGQTQRVAYSPRSFRLKQGERLFLYTAGLADARRRDGKTFGEEELRPVLNRTRQQNVEAAVSCVADEAEAFCAEERDRTGFAALMLGYRKGDRELSRCVVSASSENRQRVLDFLKQMFEENNIQPVRYANPMVVAEELYSLCSQKVEPGSSLMVECGIAPDGESVTLRMSGVFGGVNPLTIGTSESASALSAAYIDEKADMTQFKAGTEEGEPDTVSVVLFLLKG